MVQGYRRLVGGVALVAILATACTEDKTATQSTTTGGGSQTTLAGGSTTSVAASGDIDKWALDYTGAKAGKPSGTPFKIGYANEEANFPEATIGIDAGVAYLNAELSGIDGHPVELVKCTISVEEDGQKCGTQFANDASINVVMTGTLLVGGNGLYGALSGKKPVVIGNGLTTTDFTTTVGYSWLAGAVGVIGGLTYWIGTQMRPKPKQVAVMYGNNDSARGAFLTLIKPWLTKQGVKVNGVEVKDPGGTAAEVQTAIQNSGADTADVFMTIISLPECIATYDSIRQLGIHPTVVTTGLCFGTPMTDHIRQAGDSGDMPDKWYFGEYGYNYYAPDLASGILTYVKKVQQYGKPAPGAKHLEYTGFAGPLFSNLMTVAKLVNAMGVDKATPTALLDAIKNFKGPMMLQVGPLECGQVKVVSVPFPAMCAPQMGLIQYVSGKWVSIADGLNGHPIDATLAK